VWTDFDKCQNETSSYFKDFKGFEAFKGLVNKLLLSNFMKLDLLNLPHLKIIKFIILNVKYTWVRFGDMTKLFFDAMCVTLF
jgi:hypothetical protein